MAYATLAELRFAAGGDAALLELASDGGYHVDLSVVALAQAGADGEIDSRARRLWGSALPFSPVPDVIRALAADEAVYRLRCMKRVQGENDVERRRQREEMLRLLEAGTLMPPPEDTYPIGDGGGGPVSGTRTVTSDQIAEGLNDRCSLKGLW